MVSTVRLLSLSDRVATDHRELRDRIGRAALQTRDQRGEVFAEGVLQLVEVRLATPPIGVGLERGTGGRVVPGHLEGTGTGHALVERGAEHEVLRRDDRLRVVRADLLRELTIGAEECDLDREVVDRLGRARGDGRLQVAAGQAVHGGHDVGGGERRAVVPLHALAQDERPHAAVGVGLPRLGERRLDVAAEGIDQIVEARDDGAVGTEVGHGDRVERTRRRLRNDAQGAALLDRPGRSAVSSRRRQRWSPVPPVAGVVLFLSLPHAARIAPISGAPRPIMEPRATNARREMRPWANASTSSTSTGLA